MTTVGSSRDSTILSRSLRSEIPKGTCYNGKTRPLEKEASGVFALRRLSLSR